MRSKIALAVALGLMGAVLTGVSTAAGWPTIGYSVLATVLSVWSMKFG